MLGGGEEQVNASRIRGIRVVGCFEKLFFLIGIVAEQRLNFLWSHPRDHIFIREQDSPQSRTPVDSTYDEHQDENTL
jgi:hypothetical protein